MYAKKVNTCNQRGKDGKKQEGGSLCTWFTICSIRRGIVSVEHRCTQSEDHDNDDVAVTAVTDEGVQTTTRHERRMKESEVRKDSR